MTNRTDLAPAQRALFCALGSQAMRAQLAPALSALSASGWSEFTALALDRHRVGPAVWQGLKSDQNLLDKVPAETVRRFEAAAIDVIAKTLFAKAETARILRAFNAQAIRPIMLKGWPLEEQLTGKAGRRFLRDIDLLVAPDDAFKAAAVLVELGYECKTPDYLRSKQRLAFCFKFIKHLEFIDCRSGFAIELHTRPFANKKLLPTAALSLLPCPVMSEGGKELQQDVPDRVSNLLYLCVHGFLHRWERAKWIADLPPLVARLTDADWAKVAAKAERWGLARPLGVGLGMAESLLGMDVPEVARGFTRARGVRVFCWICLREVLADRDPDRKWRAPLSVLGQLAAEHGGSSRADVLLASFAPKLASKRALTATNLPDRWLALNYVLRPFTLLGNMIWAFKRR